MDREPGKCFVQASTASRGTKSILGRELCKDAWEKTAPLSPFINFLPLKRSIPLVVLERKQLLTNLLNSKTAEPRARTARLSQYELRVRTFGTRN